MPLMHTDIPDAVEIQPQSESISRKRTYSLASLRTDARDFFSQLLILLNQLMNARHTGQVVLNFNQGRLCSVETIETQKINL